MKKTLILAIDIRGMEPWQVNAKINQISDYYEKHDVLPSDNLIIFPVNSDMKIYWLEGSPDNLDDIKELEEIKDRLQPVLEAAFDKIKTKSNNK